MEKVWKDGNFEIWDSDKNERYSLWFSSDYNSMSDIEIAQHKSIDKLKTAVFIIQSALKLLEEEEEAK